MSHVVDSKVCVKDKAALCRAVEANPRLEIREKKTYNWYGRHVGDYPMPAGFTKADLGKCEFAIGVKGNKNAYEVGVVKRRDGEGYTFLYDFYAGGHGLIEALTGKSGYNSDHEHDFDALMQEYTLQVAEHEEGVQELLQQGWQVERVHLDNKDVQLRVYQQ